MLVLVFLLCLVPSISLDQATYTAMENSTLNVTIIRNGDLSLPVTVFLTTALISSKNAAAISKFKGIAIIGKEGECPTSPWYLCLVYSPILGHDLCMGCSGGTNYEITSLVNTMTEVMDPGKGCNTIACTICDLPVVTFPN